MSCTLSISETRFSNIKHLVLSVDDVRNVTEALSLQTMVESALQTEQVGGTYDQTTKKLTLQAFVHAT